MPIIFANHPREILEVTFLTTSTSSGDTTLQVKNTTDFAVPARLILGNIGEERTEIVTLAAIPDAESITVNNTLFSHNIDDPITYIKYDQVEFYSAATENGPKTLLLTKFIEVDDPVTEGDLNISTSAFVFVRFSNSLSAIASAFSQAIPASGFEESTVQNLINLVRKRAQEPTTRLVEDIDIVDMFNEALDDLETKKKNWSWRQKTAYMDLTAGIQTYTLPPDLAGQESLEGVKLGIDSRRLNNIDEKDYDFELQNTSKTVLTGEVASGGVTIPVVDTSAFGTNGTFTINGMVMSFSGSTNKEFLNVTGVNTTLGTSSELIRTLDLSQPSKFSIWNDQVRFIPAPDKFYTAELKYYGTIPRVQDPNDNVVVPSPYLLLWYALSEIWKMKGNENKALRFTALYEAKSGGLVRSDKVRQTIRMQPASSYFSRRRRRGGSAAIERLLGD